MSQTNLFSCKDSNLNAEMKTYLYFNNLNEVAFFVDIFLFDPDDVTLLGSLVLIRGSKKKIPVLPPQPGSVTA